MAGDHTKVHLLGPGTFSIDGVDVGYISQAKLSITTEEVDALTDSYGTTPIDKFHIGQKVKFAVMFNEISMTQYAKAIQGGTRNVSGSDENVSGGKFAGVKETSKVILFVPRDPAVATAFSFKAWRAVPTGNRDVDFGIKQQQDLAVEFDCMVDESKADGMKIYVFGNVGVVTDSVAATATYSPADDATGVAVAVAPTITFNKAMDPASVNGDTIMMFAALDVGAQAKVAGTVTLDAAGLVATFTPTSVLSGTTAYNIIATSGLKSASGIAFAGAKTSFTTV